MFLNPWYGNPVGEGLAPADPSVIFQKHSSALAALDQVQAYLQPGWTVHLLRDGRFFYCNHATETSSWLPPLENWNSTGPNTLPYGWESAIDKDGKTYFINHLNKTTTYDDPRKDVQEEPPQPRHIELARDSDMGFGFVAGSEKPVIVRFVTEGGPSVDKLLPGDQILTINGEDVKKAPRDHVIQLVRSCKDTVTLTVCQPPLDNSARKSALLSAAKKQRLKHNPSRVRFAESVDINGCLSPSQISASESTTPFMPNVLKVFLENGQTKSFKYDTSTTVGDVLESLHQKLGIKCQEHFSLVVEHVKSLRRNKLTILDPSETLTKIAARPGAQHLRCLYRLTFVPRDAYDLLRKDSVAFEYLYLQCCNDVIQERFSPELKYDVALRLAALHIHQHASGSSAKISIKNIERDCGLDKFIPTSLMDSMKRKELRKLLSHFLKLHNSLTAPGQKQLTALQSKLHYLKIISDLPSYGAKCFSTNNTDGNTDAVILVSPRFGISQITGVRNSMPEPLCEIEQVTSVTVFKEDELSRKVEIGLKHPDKETLEVSLDNRDSEELVSVLQGYYKLLTEKILLVNITIEPSPTEETDPSMPPPYHTRHLVQSAPWNYVNSGDTEADHSEREIDLGLTPPYQNLPDGYKLPNGSISHLHDSDMGRNGLRLPMLDSNMNKTMSVYDNTSDGFMSQPYDRPVVSTTDVTQQKQILVQEIKTFSSPQRSFNDKKIKKNPEAINTSIEIRQVLEDTETSDPETTDVESVRSFGKLKHSDSLLLLSHGQKIVANIESTESEDKSESDTDSQCTPSASPAHKPIERPPVMKPSGSSFGLHSPDNLPIDQQEDNIQALIRQLENNSGLPYTFAEGTLYLDPDIIDLTMIPPPITPDDVYRKLSSLQDGSKMLPSQLSSPPTPFADRESLDQELKALEKDVGDLRMLTNTNWSDQGTLTISESGTNDTDETMSISSESTNADRDSFATLLKKNGTTPGITLAALRQLGLNLDSSEDIDSFIANLTIPPPPEGSVALQNYKDAKKMGNEYDITNFIIPPPPSSNNDKRSSDIIRRLYAAKEGIREMVGQHASEVSEKDNVIDEVRVMSETVQHRGTSGHSGLVASLQKHFESPSAENKMSSQKYNKNKLNLIKELSGGHNARQTPPFDMDLHLADALAENDRIFHSFESSNSPQKTIFNHITKVPPVAKHLSTISPTTNRHKSSSQGDISVIDSPSKSSLSSIDSTSSDNLKSPRNGSFKQASSSDSLTSSSSVETVKSLCLKSPEKEDNPPKLPPRITGKTNFKPPVPRVSSQNHSRTLPKVPKVVAPPSDDTDRPPAVPSRNKKPTNYIMNSPQKSKTLERNSKQSSTPTTNGVFGNRHSTLPKKRIDDSTKPSIPSKSNQMLIKRVHPNNFSDNAVALKNSINTDAPLQTSSPKLPPKTKSSNGKANGFDFDDSLDSGSFDQDSLEETEELLAMPVASREAYKQTASTVSDSLKKLSQLSSACSKLDKAGGNVSKNEAEFQRAKDSLTSQSRQFVTASKLFVKSATESEQVLLNCMSKCLQILQKMVELSQIIVSTTSTPLQTQTVVVKVRDVAMAFIATSRSALCASGRGMDHPSMNSLMSQATNLASVLTALMRTLKVFTP